MSTGFISSGIHYQETQFFKIVDKFLRVLKPGVPKRLASPCPVPRAATAQGTPWLNS